MSIALHLTGYVRGINEPEDGVREYTDKRITVTEEFEDAEAFHRFVWNRSPSSMVEQSLSDDTQYRILQNEPWDISLSANSSELTEWAKEIAQDEDVHCLDVLHRWMQNIPSMRLRRAADYQLEELGGETNPEKI